MKTKAFLVLFGMIFLIIGLVTNNDHAVTQAVVVFTASYIVNENKTLF